MSAPTGEKLILLHGSRWTKSGYCEYCQSEVEWSDVWFILKHDGNRILVQEIFKDLRPLDHRFHVKDANCVQMGSSLYLLGGLCFDPDTTQWNQPAGRVRCFDTENLANGWRICNFILGGCDRGIVGVAGNLIYVFPRSSKLMEGHYCGCFYDISKEEEECGLIIFPHHYDTPMDIPNFCVAISGEPESRGVLVPYRGYLRLYNPDRNSWKKCFRFELPQSGIPKYAIFNKKLYLSFLHDGDGVVVPGFRLYVFDIFTWKCLLSTKFKKFDYLKDEQLFLVAIADDKLCYLWYANKDGESNQSTLYFSRVDVCLDGKSQSVTTHLVKKVDVELAHLYNCLPFDSYSVQLEKSKVKSNITGIQGDSYSDQHEESKCIQSNLIRAEVKKIFSCWRSSSCGGKLVKEMEVDHMDRCEYCEKKIQKLEKEVQLLRTLYSLKTTNL